MGMNRFLKSLKPAWLADLRRNIRNHHWEESDDGLLVGSNEIRGDLDVYAPDGLGWRKERNLLTTQGKNLVLMIVLSDTAKVTTFYVAPASGNTTYLATWTAANFAANATELTAVTDYAETTRVEYVEGAAAAGAISNSASPAVFTSAAVVPLLIWGCGLLSASASKATTGSLLAASKYGTVRTLAEAGDKLSVAWTLTLS